MTGCGSHFVSQQFFYLPSLVYRSSALSETEVIRNTLLDDRDGGLVATRNSTLIASYHTSAESKTNLR